MSASPIWSASCKTPRPTAARCAAEYGDLERDRAALEQLSPINHIDKLRDPLLIIQGVSDPRVPVGEALQMYRAMAGKGVDGGLILFPDEGHGAVSAKTRCCSWATACGFPAPPLGAEWRRRRRSRPRRIGRKA